MTGKSRGSFLEGTSEHQLRRGGVGEMFTDRALTFVELFTVEITLFQALCYCVSEHPPGLGQELSYLIQR